MARRPTSVHWLRENANERSPYRVLVVDTETRPAVDGDSSRQILRLWAATLTRRRDVDPKLPRTEHYRGRTAAGLVALIDRLARADHTLWLATHNLSFDLAVTELPVLLTAAGWRITEAALTTDDPWVRLARGSRRLVIADSWSWFPASVEAIGELSGKPKLPLPAFDGPDDEWYDRCERDVAIIVDALTRAMDWWEAGHLGNWSITGPATGWSSYRHRRPRPHVLVDPDPDARAFEMRAVTGGRKEVRRVGQLRPGLYADLDIATAHLTAMAGFALPFRRLGRFDHLPLDHRALDSSIMDVLAWATVETPTPRYPWDSGRGTFYPVGRFRAVLAGPELREARQRGELVAIHAGMTYLTSPHMTDWALWLASLLDEGNRDVPPSVRLLAKHWSRCVPGKWAGHTSDVLSRDPDPRPGWAIERAMLMPERRPADLLRVGGERWTIVRDEWADDAFPAILAWIQSATRVAVCRLADILGDSIVSMNTDGLVVDVADVLDVHGDPAATSTSASGPQLRELDRLCQAWDSAIEPFSVRIKRASRGLTVISPQHLILDGERRLAGIPRRAIALAGGRYRFTQWPKLRVQIARDSGPGFRTVTTEVDLTSIPPTGWLLCDGRVLPITVGPGNGGSDVILSALRDARVTGTLAAAERQHAALRGLLPAEPAIDATPASADAPGAFSAVDR